MPTRAVDVHLRALGAGALSQQIPVLSPDDLDRLPRQRRETLREVSRPPHSAVEAHTEWPAVGDTVHDLHDRPADRFPLPAGIDEQVDGLAQFDGGLQVARRDVRRMIDQARLLEPGREGGVGVELLGRRIVATGAQRSDEVEDRGPAGKGMDHVTILTGDNDGERWE